MFSVVKIDPTDIGIHLQRIEHVEKFGTRKLYLNSLQSLLMALHPSENPEQKPLYLEKYRILIQVKERILEACYKKILIFVHFRRFLHLNEKTLNYKHCFTKVLAIWAQTFLLNVSFNCEIKGIRINSNLFLDIERLLQMQYNSKLYPELLRVFFRKNDKMKLIKNCV